MDNLHNLDNFPEICKAREIENAITTAMLIITLLFLVVLLVSLAKEISHSIY